LAAITRLVMTNRLEDDSDSKRCCLFVSLCMALAVVCNFSFAFASSALVGALFFTVALAGRRWSALTGGEAARRFGSLLACCIVPGFTVVAILVGYTLARWPQGQLDFGA